MADIKNYLSEPDLLVHIIKEAHKKMVGEEDLIVSLAIVNSVRLVKNREPTSDNIILNAESRAGKDFTSHNVYPILMKPDDYIHISKMSEQTFTYWHYEDIEWTWDGKQLHIEDITTNLLNSPVFKTMASGSNKAVVVVKNKVMEFNIPGKPSITVTACDITPGDEALGRFPIFHIDESPLQTWMIKQFQGKKAKGEIPNKPNTELRHDLQLLKPVEVVVPFAEHFSDYFPNTTLMRTIHNRFIDYIKASASIHRLQREKTKDRKEVIANWDDYIIGRMVLMKCSSNKRLVPTTKKDEVVLKYLEEDPFKTKVDIIGNGIATKHYCYEGGGLDRLVSSGLLMLEMSPVAIGNATKMVAHFSISDKGGRLELPTLENVITENDQNYDNRSKSNAISLFRYFDDINKRKKGIILGLHDLGRNNGIGSDFPSYNRYFGDISLFRNCEIEGGIK